MRYRFSEEVELGKFDKIFNRALTAPQNLKFREFCFLLEYFGMKLRNTKGSHYIYKRINSLRFTLSVQDYNGMANPIKLRNLSINCLNLD
jgi:predicted RNA binding protein YcfA (HicA-like mRNA interferase family)